MIRKVHKDCPFTKEQINAIKAELYYVNSTNKCANPPHPTWYGGLTSWQNKEAEHKEAYEEWLRKELSEIEK